MNPEIETYLNLLERRLSLLRELAHQFVDCRKEFVALDLDGMQKRIAEQEDLCREIRRLDPAIGALRDACSKQLGLAGSATLQSPENSASVERLGSLTRELEQAQAEVGRLNQIHAAFLRRCGKTVRVLMNFVQGFAMTYARPSEPAVAMEPAEEKG